MMLFKTKEEENIEWNFFLTTAVLFRDLFNLDKKMWNRKILSAIDSREKESGIFQRGVKAYKDTLIPLEKTKVELEYFGISYEEYRKKADEILNTPDA